MVKIKVKKRGGKLEEFMKSKIVRGCRKAGASAKEAVKVGEEVTKKIIEMTTVSAENIGRLVVDSLKKVNKKAADTFVKFGKKKKKK